MQTDTVGQQNGRSVQQWRDCPVEKADVTQLKSALGISEVAASLLVRAGIHSTDEAEAFLNPRLAHLDDPFAIQNLDAAVERLLRAMNDGERIGIVGDYDVDGVTSTVLLVTILRRFGVEPGYVVPRRQGEGYGLSDAAVERLIGDDPPSLLLALDCGTNSVVEVANLRARGIEVIIVDHHQSREATPDDCILVNPHVNDPADSPWLELCTVGLVFKLVHGLVKRLREAGNDTAHNTRLKDYLDLVALGTIADLVPLRDENRIITRHGLERLQKSPRPGIRALLDVAGLPPEQELTTPDVSFRLGPRINACGRMNDATVPVELLLGEDYQTCIAAARELDSANRERQSIERAIYLEALEQARALPEDSAGVVVFGANWHPGVVGIVAGRLAREFHRPAIVLGEDEGIAKGSGRSINGFCLQEILTDCDALLGEWGGHSMAVGVSLELDCVESFRSVFSEAVEQRIGKEGLPEDFLEIAAWVSNYELGEELLQELTRLHPFGQGNPTPVFASREIMLADAPTSFGQLGAHIKYRLRGAHGQRIMAIQWNGAKNPPPANRPIDIAYKLSWNYWHGSRTPRAEVVAWRESSR